MPPKAAKNAMIRSHFDEGGRCYHNKQGTDHRCDSKYTNWSNMEHPGNHLKRNHPEVWENLAMYNPDGVIEIDKSFANPIRGSGLFSIVQLWTALFAMENLPARLFDNPLFRHLTGLKISRNAVPKRLEECAEIAWKSAVKRGSVTFVTLAFDIGTTNRRYLAFAVIKNGQALYHTCVSDEDARVAGHFTSAAVRQVVVDVVRDLLTTHGLKVVAVVADNAANLQGIMGARAKVRLTKKDNAADAEDAAALAVVESMKLPFMVRCVCHVMQLMVKDDEFKKLWNTTFLEAVEYANANNVKISPNETRWNSQYESMAKVRRDMRSRVDRSSANDRVAFQLAIARLEIAIALLEPFAYATRVLERDGATLWDSMRVIGSLRSHFTHDAAMDNGPRRTVLKVINKRADMLFRSPAYVLIAFFSPQSFVKRDAAQSMGTMLLNADVIQRMLAAAPEFVEPSEVARLRQCPFEDANSADVTREAYLAHVAPLRMYAPSIVQLLEGLLECTPSEAAVERLFSKMNLSVNDLQALMATETVEARLRLSSAGNVFLDAFKQRKREVAQEKKRCRTEQQQQQQQQQARSSQAQSNRNALSAEAGRPEPSPGPGAEPSPPPRTPRDQRGSASANAASQSVAAEDETDEEDDVIEVPASMQLLNEVDFTPILNNAHTYYVEEKHDMPTGEKTAEEETEPVSDKRMTRNDCFKCKAKFDDATAHRGILMTVACSNTECLHKASASHFAQSEHFTLNDLKKKGPMPPREDGDPHVVWTCAVCTQKVQQAAAAAQARADRAAAQAARTQATLDAINNA